MDNADGRVRVVLVVAFLALSVILCVRTADSLGRDVMAPTEWRSGDTAALVKGSGSAVACARSGTWRGCGLLRPGQWLPKFPDVGGSTVERFAPLLYVPALVTRAGGGGAEASLRFIGVLSLLGFGMLAVLPWLLGSSGGELHRHRHLWALLMVASPLLPYAGSTWSETLSALLLAACIALLGAKAPAALVGVAALGATLTKDTAAPFVLALACAVGWPRRGAVHRFRLPPGLLAVFAGTAAGVVLTAAWNLFRFNSVTNIHYLSPTFRVRGLAAVAGQAVALLVSPNAGLFLFWPGAVVVLFVAGVSAPVGMGRALASRPRRGSSCLGSRLLGYVVVALRLARMGPEAPPARGACARCRRPPPQPA